MFNSTTLEFLMEAHNGLSAKIVEEAGFKGIWASGLTISAQLGVRDNNEASWSQVLEVVEFMSDCTNIPILLDGDTGYGNFNNFRRLVTKLEQRGIAGVCIEDKRFPKTNSFINGEKQELADIEEFCGKIKAGKDAQTDDAFCIVARVEALIAGLGMDEAIRRANAYADAGADAILIHSKQSKPTEILQFARLWDRRVPLVIVPTKYYSAPTELYRRAGISVVIWANHLLRAAINAMKGTAATIYREQSLVNIEDKVAPISEIFRLQGSSELELAETKYLPESAGKTNAVILAASRGDAFGELTITRPKCMIPVGGKPLLQRMVEEFRALSIKDINVVTGYKAGEVRMDGITCIHNPDFEGSGELVSLRCAMDKLNGSTIISYGDILVRKYILHNLLEQTEDIVLVVDSTVQAKDECDLRVRDFVRCSAIDDRAPVEREITLVSFRPTVYEPVHGEWIGLMKISGKGALHIRQALKRLESQSDFKKMEVRDLIQNIIDHGITVHIMYVNGHWINLNRLVDIESASSFVSKL